jgi:hypothetical protein
MKLYDIVQAKEGTEMDSSTNEPKTTWVNHGIAFEKEGKNLRLKLNSLPIADKNGEVWLNLFEKKPKDAVVEPISGRNEYEEQSRGGSDPWGGGR